MASNKKTDRIIKDPAGRTVLESTNKYRLWFI